MMHSIFCCRSICSSKMDSQRRVLNLESFNLENVDNWMKMPNILDDHHADYLEPCKSVKKPTPKKIKEMMVQSDKFPIQVYI